MNAGAEWVDAAVVVDGKMITSRIPADLPEFCRAIVKALAEWGQGQLGMGAPSIA